MNQSVSDAVPASEEPNAGLQGREDHVDVLKAGIFYADADIVIADRIKIALENKGCHTEFFDFHVAGKFKIQELDTFIADKQMVLWIATQKAIDDTEILRAARYIAQHEAIREPHRLTFMSVKPRECLKIRLPASLDASTSLIEDKHFQTRLDRTISSVLKLIANADIGNTAGQSTSTSNAVVDDSNNTFRQQHPNDDNAESSGMVSVEESFTENLEAVNYNAMIEDQQKSEKVTPGPEGSGMVSVEESSTENLEAVNNNAMIEDQQESEKVTQDTKSTTTNIINISGSVSILQIGAGNIEVNSVNESLSDEHNNDVPAPKKLGKRDAKKGAEHKNEGSADTDDEEEHAKIDPKNKVVSKDKNLDGADAKDE